MKDSSGHALTGQALVSDQAPAGLAPPGFDPSCEATAMAGEVERLRGLYDVAFRDGQDDDYNPETAIMRCRFASPKPDTDTAILAGWKLVPIQPTEDMVRLAQIVAVSMPPYPAADVLRKQWPAMIAASPRPDTNTSRDSDGSGEAGETRSGLTVGDSAGPKDIAQ